MKKRGNVAYRGLIEIVQALSDCSDIFLPLKTACNVILTIDKTVDVRRIHVCCSAKLIHPFHFWFVESVNK